MKIGIFGGSFNPPHNMHNRIAIELLNQHYVDKIIFVPTGSKYKYKNNLLFDGDRLKMLRLMVKQDERMSVSDFELKSKVVYTYETLEYFKKKYLNDEIYFICGTDNLSYIDEWKNGLEILKCYKILVIKRKNDNVDDILKKYKIYKDNIIITSIYSQDISSTKIRDMISKGLNVDNYMDEDVLKYIKLNNLYK